MNERDSRIFKFIMSGVITFTIVILIIVIGLVVEKTNETPNKEVGQYCYCVEKGVIFK